MGSLSLGPQASTVTSGVSSGGDEVQQKLAEYLHALQEERGKIEAFKRELPLCMHLIDEAIESAKQRVMEDQCSPTASLVDAPDSDCEKSKRTPVLENFLPLKRRWENSENSELRHEVVLGRPAWMGEAQLWTKHSHEDSSSRDTTRQVGFGDVEKTTSRLLLGSKHRQGGAFVPFNRDRQQLPSPQSSPPHSVEAPTPQGAPGRHGGSNAVDVNTQSSGQTRAGVTRKARRCWSPELHKRFVSALQQLGGSQVATPKQIRELMKVDGLTNDEVKSHLQKYRLHTRRPSPSPPRPPAHAPQMVILGWVPPPECTATGVCNHPPPATMPEYKLHSTTPDPEQHLPAASTSQTSSRGPAHSSSDSYLDEESGDEGKSSSSGPKGSEDKLEQQAQLVHSKGSTNCLADIDTKEVKLQSLRKARAAA